MSNVAPLIQAAQLAVTTDATTVLNALTAQRDNYIQNGDIQAANVLIQEIVATINARDAVINAINPLPDPGQQPMALTLDQMTEAILSLISGSGNDTAHMTPAQLQFRVDIRNFYYDVLDALGIDTGDIKPLGNN